MTQNVDLIGMCHILNVNKAESDYTEWNEVTAEH